MLMIPPGPAAKFMHPSAPPISLLVILVVCNVLFLVSRRVRTFAQYKADSTLGWMGIAVIPIRFMAKAFFWLFGLFTISFFIIDAANFSLNKTVLAALVGFAIAYGINYLVLRCEQKLYPREENGRARPVRDS
jgi:hypothetical protein